MSEEKKEEQEDLGIKHLQKQYENLGRERRKKIIEMAKLDKFTIDIFKDGKWEPQEFIYHEVPTSRWLELEQLRSKYNDLEKVAVAKSARLALVQDITQIQYDYTTQLNSILSDIYIKSANYFLGMDEETYNNSKYGQTRAVVDACSHRTVFTLPN